MRNLLVGPIVVACVAYSFPVGAQVNDWVSVGIGGVAGTGDSGLGTTSRAISADGRYVVFESWADNVVANDSNADLDVFRRDRVTGTTVRVSVSDTGGDALGPSENPSISADGRYVAFASMAGNIVAGDGNSDWDVFVRDMQAGVTARVSLSSAGGDSDGPSNRPSISADGSLVAFSSSATNLVAGFATTVVDIYLRNLGSQQTSLVSIGYDGNSGNLNSWRPEISPDGSKVAFVSGATNIVPGDAASPDVFLRDLGLAATTRISVDQWGGDPDDRSGPPSLSLDGRVVAFWSRATDLVPGDTNGQDDIFVWDPDVGVLQRVNVTEGGAQALGGGSWHAAVSGDGRYVAFLSDADNLVPGDVNGWGDIFAFDRQTENIELLSFNHNHEQADGFSRFPSITPDANTVVFESTAGNFVDGDDNGLMDVYVAHGPAALWVDGFESGDTTAWSATNSDIAPPDTASGIKGG